MQLTVRDVATLFKVPEATVHRWVADGEIPTHQVRGQFRFSRDELLEWATCNHQEVPPELLRSFADEDGLAPPLSQALEAGGIFYRVPGSTMRDALGSVVGLLRLPDDVDRDALLEVLVAREELASTAIGDGIAIPHVRTPIVLNVSLAMLSLCFLAAPIEFGALDGKPVRCLFTVVSPTVRVHLQLLSKLAFVLREPGFRAALAREAPADELFGRLRLAESQASR